jgi:putative toxin-antitoxin system antitoxin component (TIGR02293 family)
LSQMKYKAKASEEMKAMLGRVGEGGEESSVLREPEAAYMVGRVRDGLDFAEFQGFREMIGVTEERLGALLGMSRATLHRRKKSGHLDRSESDRLVRYARIFNGAAAFFQSPEAAAKWLASPALAFDGETPLDYADTEIGAREVEALLWRIENGIPN